MHNYKLLIQYDGTNYAGWQIQLNAVTIQQRISEAIAAVIKEEVTLNGSGRTDTGVHAFGQSANFRCEKDIDIYRFRYSINCILPKDISIIEMKEVEEDFHARFDARKRSYLYFIVKYKSPFYARYSYFYHNKTDIQYLNRLSKYLIREDDYSSFSKKRSETENKKCNIYNAHWIETKGLVIFYIEADRFLHGMVRTITGTLLNAAKNNLDEKYLEEIISSKDREKAGEAVPARGLFLYKVKY